MPVVTVLLIQEINLLEVDKARLTVTAPWDLAAHNKIPPPMVGPVACATSTQSTGCSCVPIHGKDASYALVGYEPRLIGESVHMIPIIIQ